ncbi:hypothetical protein OF83DRAFT_1174677 [Amylostereum chailletii]|nr:hypothetical protein OF83DRAFT_1174677 [Amylostereum chailletii]
MHAPLLSHLLASSLPRLPSTAYTLATKPLHRLSRALTSTLRRLRRRAPHPWSWSLAAFAALARCLRPLCTLLPGLSPYRRYRTPAAEQAYWDTAARWRRALSASDARSFDPPPCLTPVPLVASYVPRLLPRYRDAVADDEESAEYALAPATFRKWHKMVHPDAVRLSFCFPSRPPPRPSFSSSHSRHG